MTSKTAHWLWGVAVVVFLGAALHAQIKRQPLGIDDLFSYTEIRSARLAPDGSAAVIATSRPDWKHDRFRDDLWLWREGQDSLLPLAQSGHDPEWSPDGKYIAFLSSRPVAADTPEDAKTPEDTKADDEKQVGRVWVISVNGGGAFPLYSARLKAHTLAWAADSTAVLFSAPEPLPKPKQELEHREWKDVERWRDQERGDLLLEIRLKDAMPAPKPFSIPDSRNAEVEAEAAKTAVSRSDLADVSQTVPKCARIITRSKFAIGEVAVPRAGAEIAFLTNSISGRLEHLNAYDIYLVANNAAHESPARQLTHNEALERELGWSPDGKQLYFGVFAGSGSLEGKYRDTQGRVYSLQVGSGKIRRLGAEFGGSWTEYTCTGEGKVFGLGQVGTEVQPYLLTEPRASKLGGASGTYEGFTTAERSPKILFRHSGIDEPTELYLASDAYHLTSAKAVTSLNSLFTQRDLPAWKTYRWTADDGKSIEGVLLYPPGKVDAHHLRMLTLIHGGPADADGNHFGADWYNWAILAAASGWMVFEPNYRGSSGYGDDFMTEISPHIVSRPGKDILAGVDALVKGGIADPDHLAIGGYSYGGYMTNWLITQTTRFRSAVSGAGAVEHASNWGNDDETFDDAWYLGGTPWQNPEIYQQEAALFQFEKVKTPVHDVMGSDDIRVSSSQGYLLERALDAVGIPHTLLIFPGEGHDLGKNPWHGYIKVREELKWMEKYDQGPTLR
ncbi:MAG: prolyl oligopeptidase family serine peptidase [Bryobacteraceae bacterium]